MLSAASAKASEVSAAPEPKAASAPMPAPANRAALALEALRQELSQKHPELKPGELRAKAAKEWKALTQEARAQYMAAI